MEMKIFLAVRGFTFMAGLAVVSAQHVVNTQPKKTESDCICNVNDTVCKCTFTIQQRLTMVLDGENVTAANGELQFASGTKAGTLLSFEEAQKVITADGEGSRLVIAVNNVFPGPRIEVYEDQTLELTVNNTLPNDRITVHFHGMHQKGTPWMDGVAFLTQDPIMPGQNFVYKFSALPSGTAFYRAHVTDQQSMGLYGPLIVRRRNDENTEIKEEIIITIQDWNHNMDAETTYRGLMDKFVDAYRPNDGSTDSVEGENLFSFSFHSGLFNGKGRYWKTASENNMAPVERFKVTSGMKYRFRVIGAMTLYPMRVFILGQRINLVATDGFQVNLDNPIHSLIVHPGERYDFEWTVPSTPEKQILLIAETLENKDSMGDTYHAAEAVLEVIDHHGPRDNNPENPKEDTNCNPESKCKIFNCPFRYIGLDNYECLDWESLINDNPSRSRGRVGGTTVDAEYFFNFSVPASQGITRESIPLDESCDFFSCILHVCFCPYEQVLEYNKTIQMTFHDLGLSSGMSHAVHLHGHSFYVMKMVMGTFDNTTGRLLSSTTDITCTDPHGICSKTTWANPRWAGGNLPDQNDNPPMKDTIFIPIGGYVVIRFVSDNPGMWLLEYNNGFHFTSHAPIVIKEAPERIPPKPTENSLNLELDHEDRSAACENDSEQTVAMALLASLLGITLIGP